MKKFFFLLLVACALSTALPRIALSAESQADTATENSDSEVFVDDSDRFTAFEEELLARYADKGDHVRGCLRLCQGHRHRLRRG